MTAVDLFISYASADEDFAAVLAAQLETRGLKCWYAKRDIPIGAVYPIEISRALDRCRALLLVFSGATNRAANENLHILREIEYAAAQHKPILPVRIAEVEPHEGLAYFLRTVQWIEKSAWEGSLAEHVALVYRGVPPGATVRPTAVVEAEGRPARSISLLLSVVAGVLLTALAVVGFVERDRVSLLFGSSAPQGTKPESPSSSPARVADRPVASSEATRPPPPSPVPPSPAAPVVASPTEVLVQARAAIGRQEYRAAFGLLSPLSEAGNGIAQYHLGWLYETGQGVPRDPTKAVDLVRAAARRGQACAMNRLGELYEEGALGYRDRQEAVRWWRSGAEAGCPWAKLHLGLAYKDGIGVVRNATDTIGWLTSAADDGVIDAISHLAAIYRKGELVPTDLAEVVRRLRQGASLGHENAQYRLAMMLEAGQGLPRDPAEAYVWASVAAVKGEPEPARFRNSLARRLPPSLVAELDVIARRRGEEIVVTERAGFTRLEDWLWRNGR
jgi:TPR repeat protein